MIVFNDKKDKEVDSKKNSTYDLFIGVIIALSHMTFVAFANFGQKLLCKEKMIPEVQNYYLGLLNAIPAFILMLIERKTGISNIIYTIILVVVHNQNIYQKIEVTNNKIFFVICYINIYDVFYNFYK